MSTQLDKYGHPTNLEDPYDSEILYQKHIATNCWWTSLYQNRATRDRNVTFDEALMMVATLLKQYESFYLNHPIDETLLHFPYLFRRPQKGDQIKNKSTGEFYTILEAPIDPITKRWEGLVKLKTTDAPPKRTSQHKLEFINDERYVRFTSENPVYLDNVAQDDNEHIQDKGPVRPTVVYALIRRSPGSIGERPFGPAKQYRSRLRETVRPDDDPNHIIEIYGQWFDNLVQFDCWTTDNFSADRLADWFERFVCLYGKVLKKNGVQEVLFMERLRDKPVSKWRQDLQSRALQYFLRTESLEARAVREITDIDLTISLSDEIVKVVGDYYVAGQTVSGQISAQEYKDLFFDSSGNYMFGTVTINDNQT